LDKPTKVTNASGNITLVNQVGWAGLNLGRIDFYFDKQNQQTIKDVVFEL
jgi:5'-nucleotidase